MKLIRILSLLLLLLTLTRPSRAEQFSYVFIQGDKKTPIYTKVEGMMMPRYGKNYALLAPLAPGPMNLEILFQQNEHPPLHFQILVPENGKRAFLLSKKDGKFALYDIQQNFYLPNDNAIEDDHLPTVVTNQLLAAETKAATPAAAATQETPANTAPLKDNNTAAAGETEAAAQTVSGTEETGTKRKPEFIEGITFDNEHNNTDTKTVAAEHPDNTANANSSNTAAIVNSDCKANISNDRYFRLRGEMKLMTGEDQRLGALEEAVKQYCFSSKQAGELIQLLNSDIARLSALKSLYPKISDQGNYASLASLLSDNDSKNYFLNFLNK